MKLCNIKKPTEVPISGGISVVFNYGYLLNDVDRKSQD